MALCKENRLDEALGVFKQQPHPVGASSLIAAIGKQRRGLDRAFDIFNALIAAGHQPDTVVINALVGACRRCGQPGRALRLMDDIDRFGVKWNEILFHLLAAACGEAGDAVAAKKLLAMMRRGDMGFKADTTDCGQLVKALVSGSSPDTDIATHNLDDALSVLDLMDEQGIPLDAQLFAMLLPACGDNGELDQGKQIHSRILHSKVAINEFLGSSLISMYSKCGSLDDAISVFTDMRRHRGGPDLGVSVWNGDARGIWAARTSQGGTRYLPTDARCKGEARQCEYQSPSSAHVDDAANQAERFASWTISTGSVSSGTRSSSICWRRHVARPATRWPPRSCSQ